MAEQQNPFIPPEDSEKLITWLQKKWDKNKRKLPELKMKMNLAFVQGEQWLVWDPNQRKFKRPRNRASDPNSPIRITANKIGGIVERQLSKLTSSHPIPETRPVSDDPDDVTAAKIGTRILTHEMHRLGWESFLPRFYFWPATVGWGFVHVRWNPNEGRLVGKDDEDDSEVRQGETTLEIVPPFELVVDPNAQSMETARWCIRTTAMTREAIWERWGKLVPDAEPARTLVDEVNNLTDNTDSVDEDMVQVHQYWLRPGSRAKPEGMVVTWAGQTLLEEPKRFPYDHKTLPFVQFDLLPGIGHRNGRTWVDDLIPLQIDYNDARSREAMARRVLTPKLLAPVGSIDHRKITSRIELVTYNPTGPEPRFSIPDSSWINQYEAAMGRADGEMGDRAGVAEVSKGEAKSGMSAAAIMALQEADDTKLGLSVREMARGVERVGWQILMLVRQFWTEERTVRAWSTDEADLEIGRWKGADVGQQLDVHLSTEDALPRSKTAKAQLAMELHERGFITDPRHLVRLLELPGVDFLIQTFDLDAKKQRRELGKLMKGEDVEVDVFDNHAIHLEEINKFRKTVEYEQLSDDERAVVDAHATVHSELLGQAGAAASALGGGPSGAGQGGGPPGNPLTGPRLNENDILAPGAAQQVGQPNIPGQSPGVPADIQAARQGN